MVKYIRFAVIFFAVGFPLITMAVLLKPFGGKIITAPTPGVSCPAGKEPGSPFTVSPVTKAPPWIMVGDWHPISTPFKLEPDAWILGLYNPKPIPECVSESVPPAPISGYRTIFHGTSAPYTVKDLLSI